MQDSNFRNRKKNTNPRGTKWNDILVSNLLTNYRYINPFSNTKKSTVHEIQLHRRRLISIIHSINNISQNDTRNMFHLKKELQYLSNEGAVWQRRQNENIEILILHRNAFACQSNMYWNRLCAALNNAVRKRLSSMPYNVFAAVLPASLRQFLFLTPP